MDGLGHIVGDESPQSGDSFGGVTLIRTLGAGGFGTVWLAVDGVGVHVAIKLISKRLSHKAAADREQKAAKLLRECVTDHPNIVKMHHVGSSEVFFFYTMDLADSEDRSAPPESDQYKPTTLQSLLARGVPLSPDDAAGICLSLVAGLSHLHERNIVHRDVKPANVLKVGGCWKLADFGVATTDQTELTTVGTLGYLAPNGKLGMSADLFAVGKILYCLVTGNRVEDFPSIGKLLEDPIDRTRRSALIRVVNKACSQDPKDRYMETCDFAADVRRAVDADRIRRSRNIRRSVLLIASIVGSAGLGFWLSQPKPIGVGDVLSTITIPATYETHDKVGGDVVTFVVTHDRVWEKRAGGNDHRYLGLLRVHDVSQWGIEEAVVIAEQLGGHLVALETPEENAWVFSEIAGDPRLWHHFIRKAHDDYFNDSSARLPELNAEEKEYLEKYGHTIRDSVKPGFVPIPAANGPMIGIWVAKDGRSVEWFDENPVENGSWGPFEPYFPDGEFHIAFGYANMQGRVPLNTWVRRNYQNAKIENMPNMTISFIVEISD